MDIDIREHIKNNFKDSNIEDIRTSINEALNEHDDVTLPGLGVFFEILWQNSDDEKKEDILNCLLKHFNN